MADEESKAHATAMLEAAGYVVTQIDPVPGERRADLLAERGEDLLVVEAKGKGPHEQFQAMLEAVNSGGLAECIRAERAWNALSRIVEYADSQLRITPAAEKAVRILWISALHGDWNFVCEGFRRRLHGTVDLSVFKQGINTPELVGIRPCFYYDHADFTRYRDIDAAILAAPHGALVLVNEFGGRVAQLRTTYLYREMNARGALVDPAVECGENRAFAIRKPGLREPTAKWSYLKHTYGVLTSAMHGSQFNAIIRLVLEAKKGQGDTNDGPV